MKTISILIAARYPVVKRGLRASLEEPPAWKVVAEAATGQDAVKQATEIQPDVSGPSGAAAKLGIPQSTLDSKIKSLKINKQQFRRP